MSAYNLIYPFYLTITGKVWVRHNGALLLVACRVCESTSPLTLTLADADTTEVQITCPNGHQWTQHGMHADAIRQAALNAAEREQS